MSRLKLLNPETTVLYNEHLNLSMPKDTKVHHVVVTANDLFSALQVKDAFWSLFLALISHYYAQNFRSRDLV